MKYLASLLLVFFLILFLFIFTGCGQKTEPTQGLTYTYDSKTDTCTVTGIGQADGIDIEIPPSIDGHTVVSIADQAFKSCAKLKTVSIPESVTGIGSEAFCNCYSLSEITYGGSPEQWDHITKGTNWDANTSLYTLAYIADSGTCGDGLTWTLNTAGKLTVSGSGSMDNYTESEHAPWHDCASDIENIVIRTGVESIGSNAFIGCSNLSSVTIGNSVTDIGDWAFWGCGVINRLDISDIAQYNAISGLNYGPLNCSNGADLYCGGELVTDLVIPDTATSVNNYAFMHCTSLTSVTIPDSVTGIGIAAFYGCSSLTSIDVPVSVISIGDYAFYGCSNLISVTIPDGVTNIGYNVFFGCSNMTFVTIPGSVTSIGIAAFYGCSNLISATIPDSVTTIGSYAFVKCSSLASITYTGTVAQWNSITKDTNWNEGTSSYTVYCTDGDISK